MLFCFACLLMVLLNTSALSQSKQTAIWHVGNKRLDFNTNPVTITDIKEPFFGKQWATSLCDKNGQLLVFYAHTNETLYNGNYKAIQNGANIRGYILIPIPNNDSLVYFIGRSKYSIIDVKNNKLISKNIAWNNYWSQSDTSFSMLYPKAIYHSNCNDIWLISRKDSCIYSNLLTNEGISKQYIQTFTKKDYYDYNIKMSPNGTHYCSAERKSINGAVYINFGSFNRTTGIFTETFNHKFSKYFACLGIAFSPDGKKLYLDMRTRSGYELLQINIINEIPQFDNPELIFIEKGLTVNTYTEMQLGIDEKIYKTFHLRHKRIDIIHNPNIYGKACNFQANAISLNTKGNSFPRFISSYMSSNPCELSFYSQNFCFGDYTMFNIKNTENIKSVLWNFGDGSSSTELSPEHYYAAAGEYTVSLRTTFNNGSITTETQTINITHFNQLIINN